MAESAGTDPGVLLVGGGLDLDDVLKILNLPLGQGQKERFKQDHGLPEAGIEIKVGGVQAFPVALRLEWRNIRQLVGGFGKILAEVVHKFLQGAHLVEELRTLGQ